MTSVLSEKGDNVMSKDSSPTNIPPELQRSWPAHNPPSPDFPIPNRLNLLLVAIVFPSALALLWLGSQAESWYAILGIGVIFSYVLLTNYA
jgi:hypothetical protein